MQKFETHLFEPSKLSFAIAVAGASYLGFRCFSDPNRVVEATKKIHKDDRFKRFQLITYFDFYRYFVVLSGFIHCAFILFQPFRPSRVCPNLEDLNTSLFSWNMGTTFAICSLYLGGTLRIAAYRQLGKQFTYKLTTPNALKTDGMYRYVQHPSYTAMAICTCGVLSLLVRFDGGLGCFVPKGWSYLMNLVNFTTFISVVGMIFAVRVVDEEKMLFKTFGQKWEQYHRKTSRFIPGIF